MTDTLLINYYLNTLRLYEIVLHTKDNLDDFKPPFEVTALTLDKSGNNHLLSKHLDFVITLLNATHNLLDHVSTMSIPALRASPVINYVSMCYCLLILIKLGVAVSDPATGLTKYIDSKELNIGLYLDKLHDKLMCAWGPGICQLAEKNFRIVDRTRTWYQQQQAHNVLIEDEQRLSEEIDSMHNHDPFSMELDADLMFLFPAELNSQDQLLQP